MIKLSIVKAVTPEYFDFDYGLDLIIMSPATFILFNVITY